MTQNGGNGILAITLLNWTIAKRKRAKDAKGKTIDVEKVSASHILFRYPSLEKYLDTEAKNLVENNLVHFILRFIVRLSKQLSQNKQTAEPRRWRGSLKAGLVQW